MRNFKKVEVADDFGCRMTIYGRSVIGFDISTVHISGFGALAEKRPENMSPEIEFAVSVVRPGSVAILYYKSEDAAEACYNMLTEKIEEELEL